MTRPVGNDDTALAAGSSSQSVHALNDPIESKLELILPDHGVRFDNKPVFVPAEGRLFELLSSAELYDKCFDADMDHVTVSRGVTI
jgi:hypothetical protein